MRYLVKVYKCPKCLEDLKKPTLQETQSLHQTCKKCNAEFKSFEILVALSVNEKPQGTELR